MLMQDNSKLSHGTKPLGQVFAERTSHQDSVRNRTYLTVQNPHMHSHSMTQKQAQEKHFA